LLPFHQVAASGEGSAISGYLSRCKSGKRRWKKLWLVIKGKVLYTYLASEVESFLRLFLQGGLR
jgi:hypothetical protein